MNLNEKYIHKIFTRIEQTYRLDKIHNDGQLEFSNPYLDKLIFRKDDGKWLPVEVNLEEQKKFYEI